MPTQSAITTLVSLSAFIFTFVFSYFIFTKTEFLKDKSWLNALLSFLIATIFLTSSFATGFITSTIPVLGAIIVALVFILAVSGFIGSSNETTYKFIGYGFLTIVIILFAAALFPLFGDIATNFSYNYNKVPNIITSSMMFLIVICSLFWAATKKF